MNWSCPRATLRAKHHYINIENLTCTVNKFHTVQATKKYTTMLDYESHYQVSLRSKEGLSHGCITEPEEMCDMG